MTLRTILALGLSLSAVMPACSQHEGAPAALRVMTYNIRFDNPGDSVHAWPNRRAELLSFLRGQSPDVVCVQEALASQVRDLQAGLPPYAYRGVGRDDGAESGEYCAIFFDTTRFEPLADSTVWLSPTPGSVSRGWDAALPRIVTWVRLLDRSSGAEFLVFNTHFDHQGSHARAMSASLVRSLVSRTRAGRSAILAGDFNCTESEEPYAILTRRHGPDRGLVDARAVCKDGPHGPQGTFSGFAPSSQVTGERIDHIFVTEEIVVERHETLMARRPEGFLSDHLPLIATLTLTRSP